MTTDDVKLTVIDYALDKVTKNQITALQRYFIRKYFSWMPLRAIGEITGGTTDHSSVIGSINSVRNNQKLFNVSIDLEYILDLKMGTKVENKKHRKWFPKKYYVKHALRA